MRASAQVLHVLRKDVRQNAWVLAAYGVLVVIAALGAGGVLPADAPLISSVWISLTGGLVIALAVQADPATRADVFWPTLPLRRGAVAGAKLGMIALLLLLALAAQGFALMQFRLPAGDIARMLVNSAVAYALFLAIAALAAALTADLRAFALAAVVAILGSFIAAAFVMGRMSEFSVIAPDTGVRDVPWHLLLLPTVLVLLVVQYRTRLLPGGIISAALVCLATLALGALNSPAAVRGAPDPSAMRDWQPLRPDLVPTLEVTRFDLPDAGSGDEDRFGRVHLRISDGSPAHRYELHSAELGVSAGGEHRRAWLSGARKMLRTPGEFMRTPPGTRNSAGTSLDAYGDTAARSALRAPGATLQLAGRLVVSEARHAQSIELRPGATAVQGGYRVRYEGPEGRSLRITTLTASVEMLELAGGFAHAPLTYALVGADGSLLPLGVRDRGSTSAPMVLPGAQGLLQQQWLVLPAGVTAIPAGAKLGIYEWRAVGSQAVSLAVPRELWKAEDDPWEYSDVSESRVIAVPRR